VVDNVVCATTPSPFFAVGAAYWDFEQVTDDEVRRLLREAWSERPLTAISKAAPEAVAIRSELAQLRRQRGEPARLVVWAHNSHVGDERATERANIGDGEVPETFPHAVR
jgi:hypothetical protein